MTDDDDLDAEEANLQKQRVPRWPMVDVGTIYVTFGTDEALAKAVDALGCHGRACLVRSNNR